jgi:hypothetical protein
MAMTLTKAELHCLHCGYVPGEIEGTGSDGRKPARLIRTPNGPGVRFRSDHTPVCGRCGGPLYAELVPSAVMAEDETPESKTARPQVASRVLAGRRPRVLAGAA